MDLAPFLSSKKADESGWEAEKKLAAAITGAGVTLASGLKYQAERPGWFRILFTVDKDSIRESLHRYSRLVDRYDSLRLIQSRITKAARAQKG